MSDGILKGVRVIEWGDFVSGPWTARVLADMGADVIKVEPPKSGDSSRGVGPFPSDIPHPEKSGMYLYLNMNKRGVTLDLGLEEGRAVFRDLVAGADVLVENHRPAEVEALGLTYEGLRDLRPGLIVVSVSPFGQTGPYRDYVGSELVLFQAGGIGYETPIGEVTDKESQPPLKGPGYQSYFMAGWLAATSTFVGLYHREVTGLGQHIDISEHEAIASTQRPNVTRYSYAGEVPHREPAGAPRFKPCKDGYLAGFGVLGNDTMWRKVCNLMGDPEWTTWDICADQASRRDHAAELEPRIMEWMMGYTKAELFEMGQRAGISTFPVNTVADVYVAEQFQSRGFFEKIEHPVAGSFSFPGIPFQFSDHQPRIRRRAPLLGEHNAEILGAELGRAPSELERMRRDGVV